MLRPSLSSPAPPPKARLPRGRQRGLENLYDARGLIKGGGGGEELGIRMGVGDMRERVRVMGEEWGQGGEL